MASTHLSPGATTKLPHLVFTRAGYTFSGWNTAANGSGTSYADKANITMGSGNVTLFAQWVAPPASSAYNSNTVLLLPGDGDLLDKSVSAHTVSALNGVATSTASPARGSGSVVFDGTDDFFIIPDSADFEFGSGAWSIDTWMNTNSTGSNHGLLRKHADAGNTGINWLLGDNHLGWFYYSHGGGVSFVDYSTISRASGWHHLALTYDGSKLRLFYDGTLVSTTALSLNIPDNTAPFIIGDASNYGSGNGAYQDTHFYLNGKLDEFRVTKGSAIYTTPFAPASSALDYPVCGNGVSEIGETCDDGNAVTESCAYNTSCTVCNASCQSVSGTGPSCGDGTIDANNGEACDDSNAVDDGNGCSATCQRVGACGDGAVQSLFETCDDGFADACGSCNAGALSGLRLQLR